MIISDWFASAFAPLGAWAWSVEKRLAKVEAIAEKLDDVDEKVERLVSHLIGHSDPPVAPK